MYLKFGKVSDVRQEPLILKEHWVCLRFIGFSVIRSFLVISLSK